MEAKRGKVTSRVRRARAVLFAVTLLIAGPVHATFGEDVAVLLAQLEQQLQLVSNAISTVQNLVQTVQHLSNVVQNGKTLIKKATSRGGLGMIAADLTNGEGGLNGVLNAAQNVTGLAQDTVQDLNIVGDALWDDWYKWQSQADLCAGKSEKDCALAQSYRYRDSSAMLARSDGIRLKSLRSMARAFKGMKKMYGIGNESNRVAQEAQSEEGVVGTTQLIARQNAMQTAVTIKGNEINGIHAQIAADNYAREAAEREMSRERWDAAYKNFGRQDEATDVDLTFGDE